MAQLNSLLFSVHGLDDPSLELSVQTQLAAIYTRLQEVVAMVSLAKKKDVTKVKTEQPVVTSSTSSKDQGRGAEAGAVSSATDEQKITKQLEEYQRALYKSSQKSEVGQYNPGQSLAAAKLLESQTQNSPEQQPALKVDVVSRKSCEDSPSSVSPRGEVSSVLENLRRRASRDTGSFSVVERESPPEKRSRRAVAAVGMPVTPSTSPQPTSSGSGRSKSSGKGKISQIAAPDESPRGFFSAVRFFTRKQFIVANGKK